MHGFHHLRSRMRSAKELEPFPAETSFKRLLDTVMYGVGVLAPLALLPQIFKIYIEKNTAGVSLLTWVLFMVVNTLWAVYGFVHKDKHIIVANGLLFCFHIVMVVGLLLY